MIFNQSMNTFAGGATFIILVIFIGLVLIDIVKGD